MHVRTERRHACTERRHADTRTQVTAWLRVAAVTRTNVGYMGGPADVVERPWYSEGAPPFDQRYYGGEYQRASETVLVEYDVALVRVIATPSTCTMVSKRERY